MRQLSDSKFVARIFWLTIAWLISVSFVLFGLAYLTGYAGSASSPAYAVLKQDLPLGLRGHGIAQLIIGLLLLYGIGPTAWRYPEKRHYLHLVLPVAVVYSFITAVALAAAPLVPGGQRNTGPIVWAVFTVLSLLCMRLEPPTRFEVIRSRVQRSVGVKNGGGSA